jgi:hypothetical protein
MSPFRNRQCVASPFAESRGAQHCHAFTLWKYKYFRWRQPKNRSIPKAFRPLDAGTVLGCQLHCCDVLRSGDGRGCSEWDVVREIERDVVAHHLGDRRLNDGLPDRSWSGFEI